MKRTSMLFAALIVAATASLALAGPWGAGRGMGPNAGMAPFAMSCLDLTEEQSQQIQALQATWRTGISPLQNDLFNKRAEMRLLWSDANADQGQITAKQQEMAGLQQRIQEKAMQHQLAVRNVLKHYLYLRASQKEPFDILYFTPALTLIGNTDDRSFSLSPELLYTKITNLELRLKGVWLAGGEHDGVW